MVTPVLLLLFLLQLASSSTFTCSFTASTGISKVYLDDVDVTSSVVGTLNDANMAKTLSLPLPTRDSVLAIIAYESVLTSSSPTTNGLQLECSGAFAWNNLVSDTDHFKVLPSSQALTEAFPASWYTLAFNDSLWDRPVLSTALAVSLPGGTQPLKKIWSSSVSSPRFVAFRARISLPCPMGSFSPTGYSPCELAPLGTFVDGFNQLSVTACPENLPRTLFSGSISASACIPCPLGHYCPIGLAYQPCPGGFFEPNSPSSQALDRFPENCVQFPCLEKYWCGPGSVENVTHIKYLEFEPMLDLVLLKATTKTFRLPIQILQPSPPAVFARFSPLNPSWARVTNPGFSNLAVEPELALTVSANAIASEYLSTVLLLEWTVGSGGPVFFANVSFEVQISSPVVTPQGFVYRFDVDDPGSAIADVVPAMEIVNTLCNNSITYSLRRTCRGAPLPDWLTFPSQLPFESILIEQERGLPEVIKFNFSFSHPVFSPLIPAHPTNRAQLYTTCLESDIVLNGLDSTLNSTQEISLLVLRPCAPGSFSPAGNDIDGCSLCADGSFQPLAGSTSCDKCNPDKPRTRGPGSQRETECLPDIGGFLDENNTVLPCPVGATCDQVGLTVKTLKLQPGFWRTNVDSQKVLPCFSPQYCRGGQEVLPTTQPQRRRLVSSNFTSSTCYANHTGVFCYNCLPGLVKRGEFRFCTLCSDNDLALDKERVSGIFVAIVLVLFFIILLSYFSTSRQHHLLTNNVKPTGFELRMKKVFQTLDITIPVQIVIGFLQVTGGMAGTFDDYLPPFFEHVRGIFSVLAMDLVRVIDFGCTLERQNHFSSLLLTALLPIGFVGLIMLGYAIQLRTLARFDTLLRLELKNATYNMFLITCFLVYPTVSVKVLGTFACRTLDDGQRYLVSDPGVDCDGDEYNQYLFFALLMTALYPLGIPMLFYRMLHRERKQLQPYARKLNLEHVAILVRENNREVRYLRFLWNPYKTPFYWFEVFELLRKLAQTSIVVFVATGSSGQIIFQLLVTTVSVVVLNSLLPYAIFTNNLLALVAQYAIFGISMITLLTKLNNYSVGVKEYRTETLDSFLIFFFVVVPLFAIAVVLYHVFVRNGLLRFLCFWVDWNKYDTKVAKISKRMKSSRNPKPEEENESLPLPQDFRQAQDTIRQLDDKLLDIKHKFNMEHVKGKGFEQDRDRYIKLCDSLRAEVERTYLLLADMEQRLEEQRDQIQEALQRVHAISDANNTTRKTVVGGGGGVRRVSLFPTSLWGANATNGGGVNRKVTSEAVVVTEEDEQADGTIRKSLRHAGNYLFPKAGSKIKSLRVVTKKDGTFEAGMDNGEDGLEEEEDKKTKKQKS